MYAREYIRNDDIGVLFKQHGFSLDYNYETKSFEQKKNSNREELQPAQRGKAISTSATKRKTQATAADKHPSGPSRAVLFEINTEQQLCLPPTTTNNEPQPGPSGFKRLRVSDRSTKYLPMLISLDHGGRDEGETSAC